VCRKVPAGRWSQAVHCAPEDESGRTGECEMPQTKQPSKACRPQTTQRARDAPGPARAHRATRGSARLEIAALAAHGPRNGYPGLVVEGSKADAEMALWHEAHRTMPMELHEQNPDPPRDAEIVGAARRPDGLLCPRGCVDAAAGRRGWTASALGSSTFGCNIDGRDRKPCRS